MPKDLASRSWTLALRSAGADTLEIVVYDMIGKDPFFGDGFSAGDFVAKLRSAPSAKTISLRINSIGGYLDDAKSMVNLLRERGSAGVTIEAHVDGLAASAASYLLTAADKVVMPSNAFIMIHEARTSARGRASDMETVAQVLRLDNEIAAEGYAAASKRRGKNLSKEDFLSAMAKGDVYLTAQDAVAWGLADEVTESVKTAACLVDLSSHANAPEELRSAPYVARSSSLESAHTTIQRSAAMARPLSTEPPRVPGQNSGSSGEEKTSMDPKVIAKLLGLPESAAESEILSALEERLKQQATAVAVSGVKMLGVATEAEAHAKVTSLSKTNAALMSATGASSDAEALARVMAWKHGADQTEALVRQVAELKASAAASLKEAAIQKLSREGKLMPAMHDWARANFASAESLETFAATLPPMVQLGAITEQGDPSKAVVLTADDHAVIKALGISPESYIAERKLELERAAARRAGG